MKLDEWEQLLKSYKSVSETTDEILEGVEDHLEGEGACCKGMKVTEYVRNQYSGVGPIETVAVCTRGTPGCNLNHNDTEALIFTILGLRRIKELIEEGGK